MEKQKIKYYYGLGERQLRRIFDVPRAEGQHGREPVDPVRARLDNVIAAPVSPRLVPRLGKESRTVIPGQRRQGDQPSYILRPGDVITVRLARTCWTIIAYCRTEFRGTDGLADVRCRDVASDGQGNPGPSDISLPVDVNIVVEFLSR